MKVILEEYLQGIAAGGERIARCEEAMQTLLEKWRLAPAVRALMAMKGFQSVAAMILVSELGEVHRFAHPRQVMAYLGLVPTENTSSDKRRQGRITKCGNAHARWLLVECAQHYAAPPKVSKELSRRQQGQPSEVRAISWRAQNRLHHRYTRLLGRRLQRNKAMVASRGRCAVLSGSFYARSPVTTCKSLLSEKMVRGEQTNQKERRELSATPFTNQAGADLRWQVTVANPRCLVSVRAGTIPAQARVT